jgi:hypothetical protein
MYCTTTRRYLLIHQADESLEKMYMSTMSKIALITLKCRYSGMKEEVSEVKIAAEL